MDPIVTAMEKRGVEGRLVEERMEKSRWEMEDDRVEKNQSWVAATLVELGRYGGRWEATEKPVPEDSNQRARELVGRGSSNPSVAISGSGNKAGVDPVTQ